MQTKGHVTITMTWSKYTFYAKVTFATNFLMVQWITLHAYTVGLQIPSLNRQLRSHLPHCSGKKKKVTSDFSSKTVKILWHLRAWINSIFQIKVVDSQGSCTQPHGTWKEWASRTETQTYRFIHVLNHQGPLGQSRLQKVTTNSRSLKR